MTAITFDELVEYGRQHATNSMNGVPWSFTYNGWPVSHENDDCYLVTLPDRTLRVNRGESVNIPDASVRVVPLVESSALTQCMTQLEATQNALSEQRKEATALRRALEDELQARLILLALLHEAPENHLSVNEESLTLADKRQALERWQTLHDKRTHFRLIPLAARAALPEETRHGE